MSKVDAQRAMREAKYARLRASGPTRREAAAGAGGAPAEPVVAAPGPKPARAAKSAPVDVGAAAGADAPSGAAAEGRCGHKSINGRECTREAGHAAKSHRYG